MKDRDNDSRLVYSTEFGRMHPSRGRQSDNCKCNKGKDNPTNRDGKIHVERSTKGRRGKGVSIIRGIPLEGAHLKALVKSLKQKCGTGGTIKNNVIEIQGDHRDILIKELNKLGYKAIKAGG